jgi:hypothetical protein
MSKEHIYLNMSKEHNYLHAAGISKTRRFGVQILDLWPGMQSSCMRLIQKFYSEKQEQD